MESMVINKNINSINLCRSCNSTITKTFCDLGMTPFANSLVKPHEVNKGQKYFPLHALVCERCYLVQLHEYITPDEIFTDYLYFSSYSSSWLKHAEEYSNKIISKYNLNNSSMVVEIASNDGYLLKNFVKRGIPCLGIEPAKNIAKVAIDSGINTICEFFNYETSIKIQEQYGKADLIVANNVLAHVPNISEFIKGFKNLLKSNGIITFEFPHIINLLREVQFDTIYHEHFSYLSLKAVEYILINNKLRVFDVEQLNTHGGSLRVYVCHYDNNINKESEYVNKVRELEIKYGINNINTYTNFQEKVCKVKNDILEFFVDAKRKGKKIICYGAAAKGNTLLNYCGITKDYVEYVVDTNPHKQGLLTPGTLIPIESIELIQKSKPDYILILPWNIKQEIMNNLQYVKEWGAQFVIPIPQLQYL